MSIHDKPYERIISSCSFVIMNDGRPTALVVVTGGLYRSSSAKNGIKTLKVSIISPILHSSCLIWFIINSKRSPPQGLVRSNVHSSLLKCCTAASILILMVPRSSLSAFGLSNEAFACRYSSFTSLANNSIDPGSIEVTMR